MADPPRKPKKSAAALPAAEPMAVATPDAAPVAKHPMPSRLLVLVALAGVIFAVIVAIVLNRPVKPQPPAFQPSANPYPHAIFANGIIESDQTSGENINVFPEVSGPVVATYVTEGQTVHAGQPLFAIDNSVQLATTRQQALQAKAALAMLNELKAEPRRETLAIVAAQLTQAQTSLQTLARTRDKLIRSTSLDPRSVSREAVDSAIDAARAAQAGVDVAQRQLTLTRAGAWTYDIQNQAAQYAALLHTYAAGQALLGKFTVKAPTDGVVLALNTPKGGYVSSLGAFDTYTQGNQPAAVLGPNAGTLAVRVYVDEILLASLPHGTSIQAQMTIRGANRQIPLQFVRIQPYVTPKIELSNERQEQVDLRVLPVIFHFRTDPGFKLYPGEEVDVYIRE
jgi:HlyD family secretion protein